MEIPETKTRATGMCNVDTMPIAKIALFLQDHGIPPTYFINSGKEEADMAMRSLARCLLAQENGTATPEEINYINFMRSQSQSAKA